MKKPGYHVFNFDRRDFVRDLRGDRMIVDYELHCDLLPA